MGFNTSYIVNDELNVSLGRNGFTLTRTDTFEPKETDVIIDTDNPTVIDFIDWVPRHEENATIFVFVKGQTGNFINPIGTGERPQLSAKDIVSGMTLYWDIIEYNTSLTPDPLFRFNLKQPLHCPQGVRIVLTNGDDVKSFRNSLQIRGRRMK